MTFDSERTSFKGKATLGAMSWNLPNDGWSSPWGFEDEWIRPDLAWREQFGQAVERSDSVAEGSVPVSKKPLPGSDAYQDSESFGLGQMILHFENEVIEEPPPPAVVRPPVTLPPKKTEAKTGQVSQGKEPEKTTGPEVQKSPTPEAVRVVPRTVARAPAAERPRESSFVRAPQEKAVLQEAPEETSNTAARRKRIPRRSSFSWGGLISLSLGTLGFTLLAWVYLHDTPRESDEDLRPQITLDQTPTTQALKKLRAFLDSIRAPENEALLRQSAWTWDTPSLSAFVRSNGTAFDNLRDLLEDYDWHPYHSGWHREDLSSHAAWPFVTGLMQAQSAYLERRGDEEPALVSAMDLAELSRRLQEVWAWPGYMNRALELQAGAVQLLAELLKTTHLDSATLGRFQTEFSQCQPSDDLLRQACAAYYVHEKKLLLGPASGELLDRMPAGQLHQRPGRLFFKMNETLGLFAEAFRQLRGEVSRPPYTRLSVGVEPTIRLTTPRFYHPNSNGEAYFSDHIEGYLDLPQEHSLGKARHGLVRCLFALRRYLADKRTLPAQLDELVPQYLSAVPQDPFSGEALLYDRGHGLVYSVGVNLVEEGGKATAPPLNDDREPTVDIGVSLAVPVKN